MSGRAKGPALSEAEQLRQLTREAHEAAQEAREATRGLQAARDRLAADLKAAQDESDDWQARVVAFLDHSMKMAASAGIEHVTNWGVDTLGALQAEVDKVVTHVSNLLGAEDREAFAAEVIRMTALSLSEQLLLVAEGNQLKISTRRPRPLLEPPAQLRVPGEIFVVDDPADAPAGSVIFDLR
jgi:FtsZ-binding cell division protein ZapB